MPTTPQVAGSQFAELDLYTRKLRNHVFHKLWARKLQNSVFRKLRVRKLRSGEHAKLLQRDDNEVVGMYSNNTQRAC